MLLHISQRAAEHALGLLQIRAMGTPGAPVETLKDMVEFHYKLDVEVHEDCSLDDFSFGRHVQEQLSVRERFQPQPITIGDLSGKFIPDVYNKTKTIG